MRSCLRCAEPWPLVSAIARRLAYTPLSVSGLGFSSIVCVRDIGVRHRSRQFWAALVRQTWLPGSHTTRTRLCDFTPNGHLLHAALLRHIPHVTQHIVHPPQLAPAVH
jgi:hypothetical protein